MSTGVKVSICILNKNYMMNYPTVVIFYIDNNNDDIWSVVYRLVFKHKKDRFL